MLIDSFMFFNEYDLLEGRLEYLYKTVDYFIIVETDITHNGQIKPLNYANNIARYRKYSNKIFYFPYSTDSEKYDFSIKSTAMQMDNIQRNHIRNALKFFQPTDTVMISDLDEIPLKSAIIQAQEQLNKNPAIAFEQEMYFYNFDQRRVANWNGTIMTQNKLIQSHNPQHYRNARNSLPSIKNGGYHLSYWNTVENIKYKIENFAHQEFNSSNYTDPSLIKERILSGNDLFDRTQGEQFVKSDRSSIDSDIFEIFKKYEITKDTL